MGSGSYTAKDWDKLKDSRSITRASDEKELFTARSCADKFNPKFIKMRESRDNDEHPNSTPIAIGLDVTGSMGYLPAEIIKNGLNELMKKLYASDVIPDPQLMFAACGDFEDKAPLQVTQFESDIRIAEQLMELWLEGGGCGNGGEDYQLFWYFLGTHTDTDSWRKRHKKGYAFTIGDEPVHPEIKSETFKKVFNEEHATISTEEAQKLCEKTYNLFHIVIDEPNVPSVVPNRTIYISRQEICYIPEIIITVICKLEHKNPADILGDLNERSLNIINRSLNTVQFDNYEAVIEV